MTDDEALQIAFARAEALAKELHDLPLAMVAAAFVGVAWALLSAHLEPSKVRKFFKRVMRQADKSSSALPRIKTGDARNA